MSLGTATACREDRSFSPSDPPIVFTALATPSAARASFSILIFSEAMLEITKLIFDFLKLTHIYEQKSEFKY